jgi:hypothetical protein
VTRPDLASSTWKANTMTAPSFTELAAAGPPRDRVKGPPCSMGAFITTLTSAEAGALRTMLDPASGWRSTDLAREITGGGVRMSATSVARHRRGECRCGDAVR